jgi:hypothetical protein
MKLFKVTAKTSGSWSGNITIQKGMSVEVLHHNSPLQDEAGKAKFRDAFESKYGVDLKQFASSSYFEAEQV